MAPNRYRRRTREYPHPDGWEKRMPDGSWPKTCPASRHARMICEGLRDPKSPYRKLLIDGGFEPDHWASSIEVVVQCLWEARQYLEWERLPPTKRYKFNGHWVPITPPNQETRDD